MGQTGLGQHLFSETPSIPDGPLSAHEVMEAHALIEALGRAKERAIYYEAPLWLRLAGYDHLKNKMWDLERALDNGDTFKVRLALQYPPLLPEDDH